MDPQAQVRAASEQQKSYLDLLAVAHYVVGGLAALLSCFALIYVIFGGFLMARPEAFGPDEPPVFVGCMVFCIGAVLLLLGWSYAGAALYAGRCLQRRRRYVFVLVVAVVSCLFTPFGTILGILTIILLVQPEVKALFEAAPTA